MKIAWPVIFLGVVIIGGAVVAGKKAPSQTESTSEPVKTSAVAGPCKEENVALPNYNDPGKRLKNCFVQYPGEPSRQDKSYYIVEDICGQFTLEFVEALLKRDLVKSEPSAITGLNNCHYYLNETENFLLNLEYLAIENQKKGNEFAGYRVEKSETIPMDNLAVYQEDGVINVVYLVLDPNKFISIRPSSKNTFAGTEILDFAAKLGEAIKEYK